MKTVLFRILASLRGRAFLYQVIVALFICELAKTMLNAQTFEWPVDKVRITQTYACRDCLEPEDGPSAGYVGGLNIHSGVDFGADANLSETRVKAASDCTVVAIYGLAGVKGDNTPESIRLWNDLNADQQFNGPELETIAFTGRRTSNRGLGQAIIVSNHNTRTFSLYAHLHSIKKEVYTNFIDGVVVTVTRGEPIAIMGGSSFTNPSRYAKHLHFEIKEMPELGSRPEGYYGYLPGHPDLYGYKDPREYLSSISVESLPPVAIENTASRAVEVLAAPGNTYMLETPCPTNAIVGSGQKLVASKRTNVEGQIWYFIHLSSRNRVYDGRNGGWISGEFVAEDPSAIQTQVAGNGVNLRQGPGTDQTAIGKLYDAQRFVSFGTPQPAMGCSQLWKAIYVSGLPPSPNHPDGKLPTIGWSCGQYLTEPPPPSGTTLRCLAAGTGVPIVGAKITVDGNAIPDSDQFGRFLVPSSLCGTRLLRIAKGSLLFSQLHTFLCPQELYLNPMFVSGSTVAQAEPEDIVLLSTNACSDLPLSTRFNVGDTVEVHGTGVGLRARYPSSCSDSYMVMPDGSTGTILAGPECCNGYIRWRIRYHDFPETETWSAEGEPGTGEYYLRSIGLSTECADNAEPNDDRTNPTFLPFGRSTNSFICNSMDVDWFRVTLNNPEAFSILLVVPIGKDYDLELYDRNAVLLARSDAGPGQNDQIQLQAASPGEYLIRVYGFPTGNGDFSTTEPYQLSVSSSPTPPTAGVIDTSVVWSGDILLSGDVRIVPGGSLRILPGTTIRCAGSDDRTSGLDNTRVEIIVDGGALSVEGTAVSPVVFTTSAQNKTPGQWYGIRFVSGDVSVQHFILEFAVEGLRLEDGDTRFDSYSIQNIAVRNCSSFGVRQLNSGEFGLVSMIGLSLSNNPTAIYTQGWLTLENSVVMRNQSHGIQCSSGTLTLSNVTVARNQGYGINGNGGRLAMFNCNVSSNDNYGVAISGKDIIAEDCLIRANGQGGISTGTGNTQIRNCTVERNNGQGVNLFSPYNLVFVQNTIADNRFAGLGLDFNCSYGGSLAPEGIASNVIRGNDIGIAVSGCGPNPLRLSGNDVYDNVSFELRNDGSRSIVANANFWGNPTSTELSQSRPNLSRVYDIRDGASAQVLINQWYADSIEGGNPGNLNNFDYTADLPAGAIAVSGGIDTPTTWSGIVIVIGDVQINNTLSIAPGTQVLFDPLHDSLAAGDDLSRCELIVNGGTINVNGSAAQPVIFTSAAGNKSPGQWYGLRFVSGDVSLHHLVIEFALAGLRLEDSDTRFDNYSIQNITVRNCSSWGVIQTPLGEASFVSISGLSVSNAPTAIYTQGWLTLENSVVMRNQSHGIQCSSGTLTLSNVTVARNQGYGINGNGGRLAMFNCNVSSNDNYGVAISGKDIIAEDCLIRANGQGGISTGTGNTQIRNCTVERNNGQGVNLFSPYNLVFVQNTIADNRFAGLGLDFNCSYGGSLAPEGIASNVIRGNDIGIAVSGNCGPNPLRLSGNDVYDNVSFELRNDGPSSIVATNQYWAEPTSTELSQGQPNLSRILDRLDESWRGLVTVQNPRFNRIGDPPSTVRPSITQQPQSISALLGANVVFTVSATGDTPLVFQWRKDGSALPGATDSVLNLQAVQSNSAGAYSVVVANLSGSITSQVALLTIDLPAGVQATRSITNVGSLFVISVRVTPPPGFASFFVEEILPQGFAPESVSGDGLFDAINRRLLWGPLLDGLPHTLSYTLRPPPGFSGTVSIDGFTYFYGSIAETAGQTALTMQQSEPASLTATNFAGLFAISIGGEVGRSYRIDATDDLHALVWEPVATITINRSPRIFIDPESLGKQRRFYRAVSVP